MKYPGAERILIKIGTGYIFDRDDKKSLCSLREDQMDALVDEISEISDEKEIALVTSGAIATAAWKFGLSEIPEEDYKKAQLSGIGQSYLMQEYIKRFESHGKTCSQCLLTYDDLENRKRRRNIRRALEGYFLNGVIPIVNENDLTSIEEITFGDNDILAARLAVAIDADLVIMLSYTVRGLGSGGKESKKRAREILEKEKIPLEIINRRYEFDRETGIYKPNILSLLE